MRENYNRMLAWIALLRIVDSKTVSLMFEHFGTNISEGVQSKNGKKMSDERFPILPLRMKA